MARLVIGLGGSVRGVATDKIPWREMLPGHSPPRASHVEIIDLISIEEGLLAEGADFGDCGSTLLEAVKKCKKGTLYFVDFSPLAAVTGERIYACCLAKTFTRREDALREEVAWLNANYVNATPTTPSNTNWAKAINLNALNNKSPKPVRENPPTGDGPRESISGAS